MAKAQFKKQLSNTYKFKKKTGKVKKRYNNFQPENNELKKARIVVRNLSFNTTEADIRRLYEPFGKLEEVNLLKRPDGKLVGCGFVQFEKVEDASKAIFKTNKSNFLGRTISSEWAIPKSEFAEKIKKEEVKDEEVLEKNDVHEPSTEKESHEKTEEIEVCEKKKKKTGKKNQLSKTEQRKLQKEKKRQKKSRIVIRNLPFTVTENLLKDHFGKYGKIDDINLLKKSDGRPVGVCFMQFDKVQCASQAILHENMQSLLNRPMVVDWAIPKDKFQKQNEKPDSQRKEGDDDDELEIVKEEKNENFDPDKVKIKEEKESDDEVVHKDESDEENSDSEQSDENSDEGSDDNAEDEDEDDDIDAKMKYDDEKSVTSSVASSHPRRVSNDVSEGKTIFIKNVPFSATNEDLKQCMLQFGPVYYALVCMDRLTEHSKGTAFVKFVNVEDAEKCLAAGTELQLHNQVLDPHRALHRNDVNKMNAEKKHKAKDTRNLYLIKEGVVLASSPAAQDVSAVDMTKRLQLEKWKSQMLRNLNMFVSRVRLVIHNLPDNCDDSKLRQLVKKHSDSGAVITEARVMRDLKNLDANGIGKSKGHGFVSFSKHEDALRALRSLNNNPNVFTKGQRPIVAFSIENRVMVNAKQKRHEKSLQHNPTWKRSADGDDYGNAQSKVSKKAQENKPNPNKRHKNSSRPLGVSESEEVKKFAGVTSRPGNTGMIGKFFLKKQAKMHEENLKRQKKQKKGAKKMTAQKFEQAASRKEAKPKQGKMKPDADEINFSKLVNSYKNKLSSVSTSKWYEGT
ncbi:RNA-binding protein 28 [Copidosoma floridanum]|uniref:RNA-binding protein 28 n=1 Tax=Copidosoma floridanum TaxID=29053 RepID=UPI0006C9AEB6|nr:RNA-binding protein 28 [Copidosoma floridanum]